MFVERFLPKGSGPALALAGFFFYFPAFFPAHTRSVCVPWRSRSRSDGPRQTDAVRKRTVDERVTRVFTLQPGRLNIGQTEARLVSALVNAANSQQCMVK